MILANLTQHRLRAGMVGLGMIFDDTYRPLFEQLHAEGLYHRDFGLVDVELAAVASRTGSRAERYKKVAAGRIADFVSFAGDDAVQRLIAHGVDAVCIAAPDDRHFEAARLALQAGKHVLIEKPSVLRLQELDELDALARKNGVLAKVVYHKLADPDHKKLRTHVIDEVLKHVNNGYCSLLEPKQISGSQFAEWIAGRNPGTYVAVHYLKLIDFTFGELRIADCGLRIEDADNRNPQSAMATLAHHRHWPARPGRSRRWFHVGFRADAGRLHLPGWPGSRVRYPHQLGDAGQFSWLRGAGSAVPFR
jgi:predicted dehydrogenase